MLYMRSHKVIESILDDVPTVTQGDWVHTWRCTCGHGMCTSPCEMIGSEGTKIDHVLQINSIWTYMKVLLKV